MNETAKGAAVFLAVALSLASCGSGAGDQVDASSGGDNPIELDEDGIPTVSPPVGETIPAVASIDSECSEGGSIAAFGVEWRPYEPLPQRWRNLGSVEGQLRFDSFDEAIFEADGEAISFTYSRVIEDICNGWDDPS